MGLKVTLELHGSMKMIKIITVICWSRDVLKRLVHNFDYVAASRENKATRGIMGHVFTLFPLFTVVT